MTEAAGKRRPIALVTGASSGIGEALAERFAAGGHDLVLVARTEAKLRAVGKRLSATHAVKVRLEVADLSERGAAGELAAALQRARWPIDVLVNCAGVLEHGR